MIEILGYGVIIIWFVLIDFLSGGIFYRSRGGVNILFVVVYVYGF